MARPTWRWTRAAYGGGQSPDCPLAGNATWCKRFRIAVWNTGPGTFNGQIKVLEMPPPGVYPQL